MVIQFFRGGRTYKGAKSAIAYLLNNRVKNGTAKVVSGAPDLTLKIIKNVKNKWKFSSGVISFEEMIDNKNVIDDVIDEFERTFFPGFDKDEYNILWVLHTDKNRTELHFIAPRIHLPSWKSYNLFWHKRI